MTEYHKHGVNLSAGQKTKISSYYKKGKNVSIRLSKKDLDGDDFLALTKTQLNQITKAKTAKTGVQLNLSRSQLQHMEKKWWIFTSSISSNYGYFRRNWWISW